MAAGAASAATTKNIIPIIAIVNFILSPRGYTALLLKVSWL